MKIFVPLTKVDAVKQEVWGVLAAEVPDTSGEIFDYDLSKPYFEKWNDRFEKVTDGKSLGNLRAMHGNVAAGKFIKFDYDDANKMVHVGAKVVDQNEWKKVTEGVYTGFSIGGKYLKKWADGELTRYIANPSEGSLVDSPCIPVALFQMVKDGGAVEFRKFLTGGQKPMPKEIIEGSPLHKMVQSLSKVSPEDMHTIMNTIEQLLQDPKCPKTLKKPGAAFLGAIEGLSLADMKDLADGDGSGEDAGDAGAPSDDPDGGADDAPKGDMMAQAEKAKLKKAQEDQMMKAVMDQLTKLQETNAALLKRIEAIEKQPAAPKGNVRSVSKEHDQPKAEKTETPIDLSKASASDLIKLAHQNPLAE